MHFSSKLINLHSKLHNSNLIRMVFVFGKDGDAQGKEAFTVRSQAPDVTVSVGSGDTKQEFKCYKVILSFASDYLDAMLSSSMKEGEMGVIEFPDKDPEEWKLFYDFISPQKIGEASISAVISDDNVMILLPWFNEFGINAYLKECDVFLSQKYLSEDEKIFWDKDKQSGESEEDHQTRLAARKSKFGAILGVLSLANMYSLPSTKAEMGRRVAQLLNMLVQAHDLFDLAAVTSISQSLPPLSRDDEAGLAISEGESEHLWPACEEILLPYVSTLSQEIIDDKERFCELLYCYMRVKVEKDKLKAAAVDVINTILCDVPINKYDRGKYYECPVKSFINRNFGFYGQGKEKLEMLGVSLPGRFK